MITVNESAQPGALADLDVFVGEWTMEAVFPDGTPPLPGGAQAPGGETGPRARCVFEWMLDGQNAIRGTWEKSFDGSAWEHDFTLTYQRVT